MSQIRSFGLKLLRCIIIKMCPLYNLPSLTHLDVSGNQLTGEINALASPCLSYADFSCNNFTSKHRFEKYKASYQALRYCNMDSNSIEMNATYFLEDIPSNIEQLFASNNKIYGSLPPSMKSLQKLSEFTLSNNFVTGSLPESMNHLPQLRQFDISSNNLSGKLPDFAESILSLQELNLSNQTNGFTGSIPEDLGKFQSLKILNLASNKLTGTIPSSIGNIAVLEVIDLSNNLLSMAIPPELGMLAAVVKRLDLSNNTLSGSIPAEIGLLRGASILLEGNAFNSSEIIAPLSLCMLRSVNNFDLAADNSVCPIERNALSDFYDSAKGVEWTERTHWVDEHASQCNWVGVTCDEKNYVTKLNLPNNGLSGTLCESIGNLPFIKELDLSVYPCSIHSYFRLLHLHH